MRPLRHSNQCPEVLSFWVVRKSSRGWSAGCLGGVVNIPVQQSFVRSGWPTVMPSWSTVNAYGDCLAGVVSGELDQAISCPIILSPRWGLPGSCYKIRGSSLLVFGACVVVGLISTIVFKGIFDGILLGNAGEVRCEWTGRSMRFESTERLSSGKKLLDWAR
ncbi:hypothetical protein B296_00019308 [Ensete ventricosum]|uniref:Uncharacterized protein n=1 Tax=Ensete ventricosum TaxID=4639 RepID=A0A426YZD6_ENSVE|nr:hypothetical protein B296_00019308 [Ensete ventricosum]